MSMKEKGYKIVSASATTIEAVATPALKHSSKIMLEGSRQIHSGIDEFLDTIDQSSHSKVSWFFTGLKKINRAFHKLAKYTITSNYQDTASSLQIIQKGLNHHQKEFEDYFEKNDQSVHRNWAFSSENRELIRELADYIKLSTQEFKKVPYHRLFQYFIAFGKIQKKARELIWSVDKIEINEDLEEGIRKMNYYCRYAVAIYGKLLVRFIIEKKWSKLFMAESDTEILLKYAEIAQENLLYSYLQSKKYLPAHAIVLDPSQKSIILVVRGTMSVFDCMTDLKGDYTAYDYIDPFTGETITTGLVHSGIYQCTKNLYQEIKPKLMQYLAEHPNHSLVVTGHSLGAGVTALMALIWMSDPDIMARGFLALAYAPPAVVSEEFNPYLKSHLFSCSFGNDLVCRLSFGSVKDFCSMVEFFHARESTPNVAKASEIASKVVYHGKIENEKAVQLYKDVKETFTSFKLEAPGNMLQIYSKELHPDFKLICPEGEQEYSSAYVSSKFYQEIIFSKTTFTDHMPNLYEDALKFLSSKQKQSNPSP